MSYQTISRDGNMSLQYGSGIRPSSWAVKFRDKGISGNEVRRMYDRAVEEGAQGGISYAITAWTKFMTSHGFTATDAEKFQLTGEEGVQIQKAMLSPAAQPAKEAKSGWLPAMADLTRYIPSAPRLGYANKPNAPEPPPIVPPPAMVNPNTAVASAPLESELTAPSATVPVPPGVSVIQRAKDELEGASPMDRIRLLEVLQASPGIQELVKAGLFKWQDIMKPNPTGPEHVSNPDGADPAMVIDAASLDKLQTALLQYAQQQQTTKTIDIQRYAQQTSTAGIKPGTGFYPGRSVYTFPRHIPGSLPNPSNVGWTGESFTKKN
jgi:hypothetical protein